MADITMLLPSVAGAAKRASDTARLMLTLPGIASNLNAQRLFALLDELFKHSMLAIQASKSKVDLQGLKDSLSVMYMDMEAAEQLSIMLVRTIPPATPANLIFRLQSDLQQLKNFLIQLVPAIVNTFGEREALSIVTPEFQSLSGLWWAEIKENINLGG